MLSAIRFFFSRFIRTSCYVKHITGNRLHSSSIMQAITGDLGGMQDEWGLSLGFASEVSTLAFLQHTVAESLSIPFIVEQRFCTAAHIESAGEQKKTTKRHGSSSAFCLFCRKQTDGSIKAAAPYTLGKIAVRFVTFK